MNEIEIAVDKIADALEKNLLIKDIKEDLYLLIDYSLTKVREETKN